MSEAIAVRERPILFSGEMVRAILDGTKTQTRRIVKFPTELAHIPKEAYGVELGTDGGYHFLTAGDMGFEGPVRCPYEVGMNLWVRETWAAYIDSGRDEQRLRDGGFPVGKYVNESYPVRQKSTGLYEDVGPTWVQYRADGADLLHATSQWHPSIFMPRYYSRIQLRITDVRCERLQEISEDDIEAEGFGGDIPSRVFPETFWPDREWGHLSMQQCFAHLWDSINGKRATWESNPWVFAITFERIGANT